MTSNQRERMCNGEGLQMVVAQLQQQQYSNQSTTPKRKSRNDNNRFTGSDHEDMSGSWLNVNRNKYKRTNYQKDSYERLYVQQITQSRTILNSNQHFNNHSGRYVQLRLDYASEYRYTPFKIECHAKLTDKKQGQKLVTELLKFIKDDFSHQSPSFRNIPIFDLWWIDLNGDLQIIIKTTELYVYLCKPDRYPKDVYIDICRRCGENRTNLVAHKDCRVKCHHCGGPHEFTDYKCKFIADYRRQLIEELKKHPECLPPDIQLFIPKGYRSDEDRSKSIYNKSAYEYKQYLCQQKRQQQQHIFNLSDRNAWPYLRPNPPATTNTVSQNDLNLSETIKFLSDELKQVQQKHEDE
ncbi:unnamed protein product [Didymodactylos carnosus]|uniref:Uncharacterized protein n=1 Tax=Didymodactylos carnosus TaxID=1234261 RepID=A0A814TU31_9BILA|nr:unnamed protein product [Didymodactylos carnosus]CAF3929916.1 unnamed protein product [Didymodactylos carnosus]